MPNDKKITDEDQSMPEPPRQAFLQGVLSEAHTQGYSKFAAGRLLVIALRTWEQR